MSRAIDRFDEYMNKRGLNDNKVTVQLGLSVGRIGKCRKAGRDLSRDLIETILSFYTDINRVWLLTGEGEMINKVDSEATKVAGKTSEGEFSEVNHGDAPYGSRQYQSITIPREVFEMMNKLADTVQSQQKTIEELRKQNKKINAQPEDNAGCAGVG